MVGLDIVPPWIAGRHGGDGPGGRLWRVSVCFSCGVVITTEEQSGEWRLASSVLSPPAVLHPCRQPVATFISPPQ